MCQRLGCGVSRRYGFTDRIVKNFFPAGSTVADFFTPNAIPYAGKGDPYYTFDAAAARSYSTHATRRISWKLRPVLAG